MFFIENRKDLLRINCYPIISYLNKLKGRGYGGYEIFLKSDI